MLATDFFHIDSVNGHRYYALFVVEIERRVVHLLGVTTNPNGQWVTKFTAAFDEVLRSEGIKTIRTPVRAPRANAFAERWVETVRAECLDHLLIFSHRQVNHVLGSYVEHYNAARPHRGIGLETPRTTGPGDPAGKIERRDVLGGLIHEYRHAA
jgi:putative transposase